MGGKSEMAVNAQVMAMTLILILGFLSTFFATLPGSFDESLTLWLDFKDASAVRLFRHAEIHPFLLRREEDFLRDLC